MTRIAPMDPACPECRAGLTLDERDSTRAARPVYACKACNRSWSLPDRNRQLMEENMMEQTMAGTASHTVKMRAVKTSVKAIPEERQKLPDGISVALEVTEGVGRGHVHHLEQRLIVIGREEGEIQIVDPMISRRHASLEIHDLDTVILRDLSSTNGTYHNDQLIAFCKLQDGDEIRLGSTTLTVSIDVIG